MSCAHCGSITCEGCAPQVIVAEIETAALLWQTASKHSLRTLYQTALQTAENASEVFADTGTRSLTKAAFFGVIVEVLAVSSTMIFYCALALLASPLFRRVVGTLPYFWPLFCVSMLVFSMALLVIHLIWAFSQEYGIKRAGGKVNLRDGAIFGLYACGWDLLTSPAGLLLAALYRGIFSGFPLIRSASRAPKLATAAHLDLRRALSTDQKKSVFLWSLVITGSAVLFGGFLLFLLLLSLMFIFLMAI